MINIFNQREVLVTFSMEKQAQVRDILAANGLKYKLKIVNMEPSSVHGRVGTNLKYSIQYYIYVHKKDYDQAIYLINKRN